MPLCQHVLPVGRGCVNLHTCMYYDLFVVEVTLALKIIETPQLLLQCHNWV